jgi:uncharacterized cupin superfamily protein
MSEPLNLLAAAVEETPVGGEPPPGYRSRIRSIGKTLGAERLGASIWELDPGESTCPYHYENTEEEWLLVLTGTPTLRDPDGEHDLVRGDLVRFPIGPEGGHKVTNRSDTAVRILMLSNIPTTLVAGTDDPITICVYPDSEKVSVWPPGGRFRLSDGTLGYWDGEV